MSGKQTVTVYIVVTVDTYDRETFTTQAVGVEIQAVEVRETEKSFITDGRLREFRYSRRVNKESDSIARLIGRTPAEAVEKYIKEYRQRAEQVRADIRSQERRLEELDRMIGFAQNLQV